MSPRGATMPYGFRIGRFGVSNESGASGLMFMMVIAQGNVGARVCAP